MPIARLFAAVADRLSRGMHAWTIEAAYPGCGNRRHTGVIGAPEGKGAKPGATDGVKVNYKGTLLDGKEFDGSYKRGEPAVLPLQGVIRAGPKACS